MKVIKKISSSDVVLEDVFHVQGFPHYFINCTLHFFNLLLVDAAHVETHELLVQT